VEDAVVIDLDDVPALERADPSGMLRTVLALGEQCREGYRAGRAAQELPSGEDLSAVVVCGMGGSGVAGDVLAALFRDRLGVPVAVAKGPVLPEFCQKDALVVCSSYSGTTAETLACFEEAADRGCRLIAITSGGELAARSAQEGFGLVVVPGGFMPRAAIGHLSFGLLGALEEIGVLPALGSEVDTCARLLARTAEEAGPDRPEERNPAKQVARFVGERFPVLWAADGLGSTAAVRWKNQINENAKRPAFASALPELDHNEVVGWSAGAGERFALLTLRHAHEGAGVAARFPASVAIAQESGMEHRRIDASGTTPLESLMSLVLLGDAASVYLGYLRGVDPTPIEAIDRVKAALEEGP
jgi:glucose/mannose-6-phosphate isomerase